MGGPRSLGARPPRRPVCLILFAVDAHPRHRLVLAANRDEFHERPATPAAWWPDAPHVLAGRDLRAGGTWLGVARAPGGPRWAAITNVRDPRNVRPDARSRGDLVGAFLVGRTPADVAVARAHAERGAYNGFNLLAGDDTGVWFASSTEDAPRALGPGVYGLSNATLDTPWPKVTGGLAAFRAALAGDPVDDEALLALLADRATAPDAALPDTGVPPEWERALSARFIVGDRYGARASTVLVLEGDGGRLVERTFGPGGVEGATAAFTF